MSMGLEENHYMHYMGAIKYQKLVLVYETFTFMDILSFYTF